MKCLKASGEPLVSFCHPLEVSFLQGATVVCRLWRCCSFMQYKCSCAIERHVHPTLQIVSRAGHPPRSAASRSMHCGCASVCRALLPWKRVVRTHTCDIQIYTTFLHAQIACFRFQVRPTCGMWYSSVHLSSWFCWCVSRDISQPAMVKSHFLCWEPVVWCS